MAAREVGQMRSLIDDLRRECAQRPEDRALHLVYADALTEAGDELGQLIMAQAADPAARVPDDLQRRLLGRLVNAAEDCAIELGLLRYVRLRRVTPREFTRLTGRREWEGVRDIGFGRGRKWSTSLLPAREVVDLLTHPVLGALRQVTELDAASFLLLCRCELSLERVTVVGVGRWNISIPAPLLRMKELGLKALNNARDAPDWLVSTGRPIYETLEAIRLYGWSYEELALLHEPPPRLRRVLGPCTEAMLQADGWHVRLDPMRAAERHGGFGTALDEVQQAIERYGHEMAGLTLLLPNPGTDLVERLKSSAAGVPLTIEMVDDVTGVTDVGRYWEIAGDVAF